MLYLKHLASCYVPFPYWNSTNVPGRKIVILFRNIKTAISPQPLDEILWTKTIKIISWSQAPFIILCVPKSVTWRDNLKFWCNTRYVLKPMPIHVGQASILTHFSVVFLLSVLTMTFDLHDLNPTHIISLRVRKARPNIHRSPLKSNIKIHKKYLN